MLQSETQEWRTVNVGCPSGFKNYTGNDFQLALDVEDLGVQNPMSK